MLSSFRTQSGLTTLFGPHMWADPLNDYVERFKAVMMLVNDLGPCIVLVALIGAFTPTHEFQIPMALNDIENYQDVMALISHALCMEESKRTSSKRAPKAQI